MCAVDGVAKTGGDAMKETVAIAGDLTDGDGNAVKGLVSAGVGTVPSAYVGFGLPFTGKEGVARLEEAVVVDLTRGHPWWGAGCDRRRVRIGKGCSVICGSRDGGRGTASPDSLCMEYDAGALQCK